MDGPDHREMSDAMQRIERIASRPIFAWTVAILLGLMNVIPNRFIMNPDGISYLNLATLYQHGDWASAVNGYWSPLYPFLLAVTLKLVPASAGSESTVVHGLNFVIYLGAFAAFRFFFAELRASQNQQQSSEPGGTDVASLQSLAETACAYSLFFWCAFSYVGFALVTPDMTLSLLLFIAAGLVIKLRRTNAVYGYALLGAVVGLAYLTKAVMFPLGVVMCLCCGLPDSAKGGVRRSLFAFAGFLVVASPQVIAVSRLTGHLSYGESGTIAYANEVNRTPKFWVGLPAGTGTPVHSMRLVSRNAWAYELGVPNITFSNPASDQLAWWMQGVRPHVSIGEQASVTKRILGWYVELFDVLIFASLALYLLKRRLTRRYVALILPALAAFGLYALVYAESRYVGAWAVILFLCVAASFDFESGARRGLLAVMGAVALFYGLSTLNLSRSEAVNSIALAREQSPNPQFETAVALEKLGIRRGSRVGGIGYMFNAYWARLAGVQIAMQVPDAEAYSAAPDSARAHILDSFRGAGAAAVVFTGKPKPGPGEHWQKLGPAGYWVLVLKPD